MRPDTTANSYLDCTLKTYMMSRVPASKEYYQKIRKEVKEALEAEFGSVLAGGIVYSGSIAKHTEINTHFDVDLIVPFSRDSYKTLKDMYDSVFEFLKNDFEHDDCEQAPRDQRVSIGLRFNNGKGQSFKLDIVPGRELSQDDYADTGDLNVYDSDNDTSLKTNIQKQIDAISASHDNIRNMIRLLKVWKNRGNGPDVKSILLELLSIRAYDKYDEAWNYDLYDQLKMVLTYIRENIETISLKDPGNSGNIVSDMLSTQQKKDIKGKANHVLTQLFINWRLLETFVPENNPYCIC